VAITWLADVLRGTGLTVVEHAGWKTRTAGGSWSPGYGVVHATAAPRTQSDETQAGIVRDGHSTLDGPIAHALVDRAGRWHVLAAGRCNTTVVGTAGPYKGHGNTTALGIEAANDNRAEPWPAVQYDAYVQGCAAIGRRLGWGAERWRGHKEHTPGHKTDPTFDMDAFRQRVQGVLDGDDDMELTDRVPLAPWIRDVFPDLGETISVASALGSNYGHAREAKMIARATLKAVTGGSADAVLAEIRLEGDRTRARLADLLSAAAPAIAAAVVAAVDVELDEAEVGRAVAQTLAVMLAD
jgi:hypothetical protein